ncbi:MAG: STAS/SEC14 domain-containing protein [Flavobacteriales bacterium]|nr:STAS/SEC14 domain-containing protein [Flavobacteriales bacterium]
MIVAQNGILRDDAVCSLVVDQDQRLVRLTWKGMVPGAVYREVLLQVLDTITLNGLHYWLSDSRQMGAILHEETQWTNEVFSPRLIRTGLRRVAVVNSTDFIHQMAAQRMVAEAPPDVPYEIAFFDTLQDAETWLLRERTMRVVG